MGREGTDPVRRTLLKGGGLVIGFTWLGASRAAFGFASGEPQPQDAAAARADGNPAFAPNAFIRIDIDGVIRLVMPEVEMGQGVYTGQATLIAEELCVDLDQVRIEAAPPNPALYALAIEGEQATGGSDTINGTWDVLRLAGAMARTMLVGAAAARWRTTPEECRVERGVVHHLASGRALSFGRLARAAARQPVPKRPELLSTKSFRLIGRPLKRIDTPPKTDGSLKYGLDLKMPGLRIAAVKICPTIGGRLSQIDAQRARQVPGILEIVALDNAVAAIASDFWTARKGLAALQIEWERGPQAHFSTATIREDMARVSHASKALVARATGSGTTPTAWHIEATYTEPMLAHAAMEPLNAVVWIHEGRCEIWVGTQVPERVAQSAARVTGLPLAKISVHNQFFGGAFGRRLETDWVEQAIEIARHVTYPIKLVWTREQDVQHDMFRPPYHARLAATLNPRGLPATWHHRITSPSVTARWDPWDLDANGVDPDCIDGAVDTPYEVPNQRIEWVRLKFPDSLKFGWLRGVGQTLNLFAVECFIDELAHAAGQDPVEYRRAMLADNPRARAVLELAAAKFGWGAAVGPRIGHGVALGHPMSTHICAMVEVEVTPQGLIRLRRAVAVVDCGIVVNPDTIEAQVQGGLAFGWSAALYGEITLQDGEVKQRNFNDYRVLRINEMPHIEVYSVSSSEHPTGIGEPPCAIAAPCLANAVFAATGVRVRDLPIARVSLAQNRSALTQTVR